MTKYEAIQALRKGEKITHRYFSSDEFIYMKDGTLRDENDYNMSEFWQLRSATEWNDGYEIYQPNK